MTVDELRTRACEDPRAYAAMAPDGLGEGLGEAFVENITGADDASLEHRSAVTPEEGGGLAVITAPGTVTDSGR